MTHKPVTYSPHAARRMKERQVTRQQVHTVLNIGALSEADHGGKRRLAQIGPRTIAVIYHETRDAIHVWTVMLVPGE